MCKCFSGRFFHCGYVVIDVFVADGVGVVLDVVVVVVVIVVVDIVVSKQSKEKQNRTDGQHKLIDLYSAVEHLWKKKLLKSSSKFCQLSSPPDPCGHHGLLLDLRTSSFSGVLRQEESNELVLKVMRWHMSSR